MAFIESSFPLGSDPPTQTNRKFSTIIAAFTKQ